MEEKLGDRAGAQRVHEALAQAERGENEDGPCGEAPEEADGGRETAAEGSGDAGWFRKAADAGGMQVGPDDDAQV